MAFELISFLMLLGSTIDLPMSFLHFGQSSPSSVSFRRDPQLSQNFNCPHISVSTVAIKVSICFVPQ